MWVRRHPWAPPLGAIPAIEESVDPEGVEERLNGELEAGEN